MKEWLILAALLCGVLAPVVAAVPGPATSSCEDYIHASVVAVAAVIAVGDNQVWGDNGSCMMPRTSSSAMVWGGTYTGPVVIGVLGSTQVWTAGGFTGCTMGAFNTLNTVNAGGTTSSAVATLTMTATECRGTVLFTLTITAVPVYTWTARINVNIRVDPPTTVQQHFCASSESTEYAYDQGAEVCETPIVANTDCLFSFSGLAPSQMEVSDTCFVPVHINADVLCDAPGAALSTFSSSLVCNDPNIALTGSLTATLAGSLALSGTVGLSQSGAWAFTLSGIPDTQQEIQAIADALTAGLDVTVCPLSSPCYHVLSGELDANVAGDLNTHVDGSLALTGVDIAVNNTFNNSTFDAVFPDSYEVTNPTSDFWVPVFLWLVAIIVFLWVAKLLAAAASTVGFLFALLDNMELQVLALIILGVALWLEASARERIYARWFRKRREAKEAEGRRTTGT